MKNIKSLEPHRRFIWAVVFIVASLGGLVFYIYGHSYTQGVAEDSLRPYLSQGNEVIWKMVDSAKGDLNGDGISDLAVVAEYIGFNRLVILTGIANGGYELSDVSDNVVSSIPRIKKYDSLSIGDHKLDVNFYTAGDVNSRLLETFEFRYDQGKWFLSSYEKQGHSQLLPPLMFRDFDIKEFDPGLFLNHSKTIISVVDQTKRVAKKNNLLDYPTECASYSFDFKSLDDKQTYYSINVREYGCSAGHSSPAGSDFWVVVNKKTGNWYTDKYSHGWEETKLEN